jgi:hypothetical protein
MKRLLVTASLLSLLAGCASSKPPASALGNQVGGLTPTNVQQAENYPPDAIQTFVQGCMAGQPSTMEKPCTCMAQQIQTRYTYSQYLVLVKSDSTSDPRLQEIVNLCADAR